MPANCYVIEVFRVLQDLGTGQLQTFWRWSRAFSTLVDSALGQQETPNHLRVVFSFMGRVIKNDKTNSIEESGFSVLFYGKIIINPRFINGSFIFLFPLMGCLINGA
jgi:hypothetical protein